MIAARLTVPFTLFSGVSAEELSTESIGRLHSTPLVGTLGSDASFLMHRPDGAHRSVRTIAELRDTERQGFAASTSAELRAWSYFKRVEDLLSTALIVRPSRVSFLRPISSVELLPAGFVPLSLGEAPLEISEDSQSDETIADMVQRKRCHIDERAAGHIVVKAEIETTLIEVLKGDLNSDGVEDVLLWQFHRVADGTMYWSQSLALTRLDQHAKFSKVTPNIR